MLDLHSCPTRRSSDLIVFYVLLATAAIPVAVTLIPLFLMVSNFPLAGGNDLFGRGGSGLIDTLGGIAIPYLVGTMSIFLVRQFYQEIGRASGRERVGR